MARTDNGSPLNSREAVIIEDVLRDAGFAPHWAIAAASGFRSVVATPLFSRSSEPLGPISAHFRRPPRPTQRELRYADLYAARLRT